MQQNPFLRPKVRSSLRIWLGTAYYRFRRYLEWERRYVASTQ